MGGADSTPCKNPRTAHVSHEIAERAAQLRRALALIDARITHDELARRDEASRLQRYVEAIVAKVATLESQAQRQAQRAKRKPTVRATLIMRVGQLLAEAA